MHAVSRGGIPLIFDEVRFLAHPVSALKKHLLLLHFFLKSSSMQ